MLCKLSKPKKKLSYRSLVLKLDRIFSQYIRKRDSVDGYGACISCGKNLSIKEAHAGHYVNRAVMSLRFDEKNVNMQCPHCNTYRVGNSVGYTLGLINKYGKDVIEYLAAAKRKSRKFTCEELEILIKLYKDKLNINH
jgi:hypothetical protein